MIISKETAKSLFNSGNLRPVGVCVDKEKGTYCVYDNLRSQRTDHVKIDSLAQDYSIACAHWLAML